MNRRESFFTGLRTVFLAATLALVGCDFVHPYSEPEGPCDDLKVGDKVSARITGYENPELLSRSPWECEKIYGVKPGLVIEARIEEVGSQTARSGCQGRIVSVADFGKVKLLENVTEGETAATVRAQYSFEVLDSDCAGSLGVSIFQNGDPDPGILTLGFGKCPSMCQATYSADVTVERASPSD